MYTSSKSFRCAAAVTLVFTASVALRRGLLVTLVAAKILGSGDGLDAWKGAVSRQTAVHGGIPIDIYRGSSSTSPVLIVHGVNPTGKDSLDLVRISQALAQAGYEVYVPDLIEMKRQHLRPQEVENVKSIFRLIGRRAALACFSYGCGPALVAAADPDIRDRVRFVAAFGGYFDIREALEFLVTGPTSPLAYSKWIYLAANTDLVESESDQGRLRHIAEARTTGLGVDPELLAGLSPEAQALLHLFESETPAEFEARMRNAPGALRSRLDALSPSRFAAQLRGPLILIHGVHDPCIPANQSMELDEAARLNSLNHQLVLLRMYGHTNPMLPPFAVSSAFGYYIPEAFRFLRVVNRLIAMR